MILTHTIEGCCTYRVHGGLLVVDSHDTGRTQPVRYVVPGTNGRTSATVTVANEREFRAEVAAAERRRLR